MSRQREPDAFLRAVLAPLPKGEEPVCSIDYLTSIEQDERDFWKHNVDRGEAFDVALGDLRSLAKRLDGLGCPVTLREADRWLSRQLLDTLDRLMKRPAADMSCVEFKRRHVGWSGGFPGWEDALAADEARVRPGGRLRRLVEPGKAKEARP